MFLTERRERELEDEIRSHIEFHDRERGTVSQFAVRRQRSDRLFFQLRNATP
jgi:hypothetical protein